LRFVSPALKHIVYPALSRSGYLRYTAGVGPAVVTYHGVFPAGYEIRNPALDGNLVRAESLRRQLQLLKKRYHVITPESFLGWFKEKVSLPPRSILLTCDDALRNTLTEMLPILQELGLSCLFFATGASVGKMPSMLWYEELYLMLLDASEPIALNLSEAGISIRLTARQEKHTGWWNLVERLSQFDREKRRKLLDQTRDQLKLSANWRERFVEDSTLASRFLTLDLAGLRQLAAAGMSIGAHSLSHPILARAPDDLAWQEISESRRVLEQALGQSDTPISPLKPLPDYIVEKRFAEPVATEGVISTTLSGLAGMLVAAFLPPCLYLTQYVTNELLAAVRTVRAGDYKPPVPEDDGPRVPARSGEKSGSDRIPPEAVAMVDAISESALSLGWKNERLYGKGENGIFDPRRGLVCFLKPGDRIGEVTLQSIEIIGPPPSEVRQRFYNPDVDQPWIKRIDVEKK